MLRGVHSTRQQVWDKSISFPHTLTCGALLPAPRHSAEGAERRGINGKPTAGCYAQGRGH